MAPEPRRKRRANLFSGDLASLLYAYGDVKLPRSDTIAVLEDILQEYIAGMCIEASRVARVGGRQKLKVEDFKFALRRDPRKLGRVEELLALQKEIDRARKQFDNTEGKELSRVYEDDDGKTQGDTGAGASEAPVASATTSATKQGTNSPSTNGSSSRREKQKGEPSNKSDSSTKQAAGSQAE